MFPHTFPINHQQTLPVFASRVPDIKKERRRKKIASAGHKRKEKRKDVSARINEKRKGKDASARHKEKRKENEKT